jgi:hypothetical protein
MDAVHRVLVMSAFLVLLSGPESGLAQTPEATSIPQLQSTFSIAAVDSDHLESVWVEQLRPPLPGVHTDYSSPNPFEVAALQERKQPWWRYPLIGFGIGAAAGGLYGLYADLRCGGEDNWFCGTYTVSYAVIGGVVGAVTGSVLRFGRRESSRDST